MNKSLACVPCLLDGHAVTVTPAPSTESWGNLGTPHIRWPPSIPMSCSSLAKSISVEIKHHHDEDENGDEEYTSEGNVCLSLTALVVLVPRLISSLYHVRQDYGHCHQPCIAWTHSRTRPCRQGGAQCIQVHLSNRQNQERTNLQRFNGMCPTTHPSWVWQYVVVHRGH